MWSKCEIKDQQTAKKSTIMVFICKCILFVLEVNIRIHHTLVQQRSEPARLRSFGSFGPFSADTLSLYYTVKRSNKAL